MERPCSQDRHQLASSTGTGVGDQGNQKTTSPSSPVNPFLQTYSSPEHSDRLIMDLSSDDATTPEFSPNHGTRQNRSPHATADGPLQTVGMVTMDSCILEDISLEEECTELDDTVPLPLEERRNELDDTIPYGLSGIAVSGLTPYLSTPHSASCVNQVKQIIHHLKVLVQQEPGDVHYSREVLRNLHAEHVDRKERSDGERNIKVFYCTCSVEESPNSSASAETVISNHSREITGPMDNVSLQQSRSSHGVSFGSEQPNESMVLDSRWSSETFCKWLLESLHDSTLLESEDGDSTSNTEQSLTSPEAPTPLSPRKKDSSVTNSSISDLQPSNQSLRLRLVIDDLCTALQQKLSVEDKRDRSARSDRSHTEQGHFSAPHGNLSTTQATTAARPEQNQPRDVYSFTSDISETSLEGIGFRLQRRNPGSVRYSSHVERSTHSAISTDNLEGELSQGADFELFAEGSSATAKFATPKGPNTQTIFNQNQPRDVYSFTSDISETSLEGIGLRLLRRNPESSMDSSRVKRSTHSNISADNLEGDLSREADLELSAESSSATAKSTTPKGSNSQTAFNVPPCLTIADFSSEEESLIMEHTSVSLSRCSLASPSFISIPPSHPSTDSIVPMSSSADTQQSSPSPLSCTIADLSMEDEEPILEHTSVSDRLSFPSSAALPGHASSSKRHLLSCTFTVSRSDHKSPEPAALPQQSPVPSTQHQHPSTLVPVFVSQSQFPGLAPQSPVPSTHCPVLSTHSTVPTRHSTAVSTHRKRHNSRRQESQENDRLSRREGPEGNSFSEETVKPVPAVKATSTSTAAPVATDSQTSYQLSSHHYTNTITIASTSLSEDNRAPRSDQIPPQATRRIVLPAATATSTIPATSVAGDTQASGSYQLSSHQYTNTTLSLCHPIKMESSLTNDEDIQAGSMSIVHPFACLENSSVLVSTSSLNPQQRVHPAAESTRLEATSSTTLMSKHHTQPEAESTRLDATNLKTKVQMSSLAIDRPEDWSESVWEYYNQCRRAARIASSVPERQSHNEKEAPSSEQDSPSNTSSASSRESDEALAHTPRAAQGSKKQGKSVSFSSKPKNQGHQELQARAQTSHKNSSETRRKSALKTPKKPQTLAPVPRDNTTPKKPQSLVPMFPENRNVLNAVSKASRPSSNSDSSDPAQETTVKRKQRNSESSDPTPDTIITRKQRDSNNSNSSTCSSSGTSDNQCKTPAAPPVKKRYRKSLLQRLKKNIMRCGQPDVSVSINTTICYLPAPSSSNTVLDASSLQSAGPTPLSLSAKRETARTNRAAAASASFTRIRSHNSSITLSDADLDKAVTQLQAEKGIGCMSRDGEELALCLVDFLNRPQSTLFYKMAPKQRKQLTKLATTCYVKSESSRHGITLTKTTLSRVPVARDVLWLHSC